MPADPVADPTAPGPTTPGPTAPGPTAADRPDRSAAIDALAARPVPRPPGPSSAVPEDLAGGRAIPIAEDDPRGREPLVDIADFGLAGEAFYARTDGANAPYRRALDGAPARIRVRHGVAERLRAADARLSAGGLALFLLDGWRPLAVQHALWTFFLDRARAAGAPDEAAARQAARQYCGDPTDYAPDTPATWPSHLTGGAVDLTLARRAPDGRIEPLFMGGIFDDPSPISHTAAFETAEAAEAQPDRSASAEAARANRRILYWTLREAGFTNLATEWWHYDFGDRLWSATLAALGETVTPPAVLYGPATPEGAGA